jgi:meso-butanediol dehydrogenase / (S,S)-butanediol dehydrogenase / diacetyl reductase
MGKLDGRVAMVTGGASGIGKAACVRLSQEGAKVIFTDSDEEGGKRTEGETLRQGAKAEFIKGNVSSEVDWRRVIAQLEKVHGRLDVVFNNAGFNLKKSVTSITSKEWEGLMAVNLKGVFLGMKYAIPLMLKGGGGSIINNASSFGIIGYPEMAAYCASKGGIIALTRQVALDYARSNIRVNCICPGPTHTTRIEGYIRQGWISEKDLVAMVPLGRMAYPEEIAAVVAFLASDDASYITGTALPVDGGQTAH